MLLVEQHAFPSIVITWIQNMTVWQTSAITCFHQYLQASWLSAFIYRCSEMTSQWPFSTAFWSLPFFLPFFSWYYSSCYFIFIFFSLRHSAIYSLLHTSSLFTPTLNLVFSFLFLIFLSISYVLLSFLCFPPHFSLLSTHKLWIFGIMIWMWLIKNI